MRKKKLYIFLLLIFIGMGIFFVLRPRGNDMKNISVPDDYVVYNLGKTIDFTDDGNSLDFIAVSDAWGGQESTHRCINSSTAHIKLFVPDMGGSDLRFTIDLYGIYAPDEKCQDISVFANNTQIAQWCVPRHDIFSAVIPASILSDGLIDIRLDIAKPYTSNIDFITRGAAVREITLEKIRGNQTKKKISRWVQDKLFGNKPMPEYGMQNKESETKTNAK